MEKIKSILSSAADIHCCIVKDDSISKAIAAASTAIAAALKAGNKVFVCGNGGSAADAQHIAAEFSGRFYFDRPPLPAEALHANTSYLTAVSNDYSYEEVYSRILRASGRRGDVLMALSTSGNSSNIISSLKTARELGLLTVGFTGKQGGKMRDLRLCDHELSVPSDDTPRIQEGHILLAHVICQLVEESLFGHVKN